jgi:hypothetical protein
MRLLQGDGSRGVSPTARSLQRLRAEGWTPGVVERWNPGARVRQDFLGFADLLAVRADTRGAIAIQACMVGDQAKRLAKIRAEPRAQTWLQAGNTIEVWGWAKRGPRGKRKTWQLTRTSVDDRL